MSWAWIAPLPVFGLYVMAWYQWNKYRKDCRGGGEIELILNLPKNIKGRS